MNFHRVGTILRSLAAVSALTLLLATAAIAEDATEPATTPTAEQAASAGTAPPAEATPAKATGEFGMNYTPTAGIWRDKLIAARKNVLKATASLDDVNAEYARVLYEHPDDTDKAASLAKQRAEARQELSAAKSAIPDLVEGARADGVSERVLDLYEHSLDD